MSWIQHNAPLAPISNILVERSQLRGATFPSQHLAPDCPGNEQSAPTATVDHPHSPSTKRHNDDDLGRTQRQVPSEFLIISLWALLFSPRQGPRQQGPRQQEEQRMTRPAYGDFRRYSDLHNQSQREKIVIRINLKCGLRSPTAFAGPRPVRQGDIGESSA